MKTTAKIIATSLPTSYGRFTLIAYRSARTADPHLALVRGDVRGKKDVLVRVHSECMTGDLFHSERCDCREQLEKSLKKIGRARTGILLYMRQEGRGIGLVNKLRAYALQDKGMNTVEANEHLGFHADLRDYTLCAAILRDLGVRSIRLLTNNLEKIHQLTNAGVTITTRVPLIVKPNATNQKYLKDKQRLLGHLMTI